MLNNVKEINRVEQFKIASRNSGRKYLIKQDGSFIEATNLIVGDDVISHNVEINRMVQKLETKKRDLVGITFIDYSRVEDRVVTGGQGYIYSASTEERKFNTIVDFSLGAGYLLGRPPKNASAELKKYLNEMRLGFAYEAKVTFMISEFTGIGPMFNGYSTSNSIYNFAEDNVSVRFLGLNIAGMSPLSGNSGFVNYGMALGPVFFLNEAKAMSQNLRVTGQTLGIYMSLGFDFKLSGNLYLGMQTGLLAGNIRNLKINGRDAGIEDPESVHRFDGKISLKFYF